MNKRQKLVQEQFLNNEEKVIKSLNQTYGQSLKGINDKIQKLQFDIDGLQEEYDWMDDNDPKKEVVKSKIQSKIYQKQYQEQLHKQVDGILNEMQTKQFLTVSDYLDDCYTDGFIGTIFDMHGQGVPLIMPIDQESMVRAVQLDSKISQGLYTRLGEDVDILKKKITAQVSRSISTGISYAQTAKQLSNYTRIGYNNAVRIARTEGHRIQNSATMDACQKAKDYGADVVKQWDSTLDDRTRESHVTVDGEWRELDDKFSNGLMYPGDPSGGATEVINCRCALLQRARWAVDGAFTKYNRFTDEIEEFENIDDYKEFKRKYLEEVQRQVRTKSVRFASSADKAQFGRYQAILGDNVPKTLEEFQKIKYNRGEQWETLKYQYRTVNRYEVDGNVTADTILQLDNVAFYGKKRGFDYSAYSGSEKNKIQNEIGNCGNAASMELDGKIYFSHSKFGLPGSFEHSLYNGEYSAVTLSKHRRFKYLDLGEGIPRKFDTEAKFLEFVASQKNVDDKFTVTILSEKHICKSCQGVVNQFKQMFPNSTVNIISGKRGYNGDEKGLHTWKHRKKVK